MPRRRWGSHGGWGRYVPAAERHARAARGLESLRRNGTELTPVRVAGRSRAVAETFWGRAWCENLESYSDFANRLPRGRTYVRNGSVWDLRICAGRVTALVIGRQPAPYRIEIAIQALPGARWRELAARAAGRIASLVELLEGRLDRGVMDVMVDRASGLFPAPAEIRLSCSCPDWASLCKHVAAALYGVGVRLDASPELLFVLRGVDPLDLVAAAGHGPAAEHASGPGIGAPLDGDLAGIFGIDLDGETAPAPPRGGDAPAPPRARSVRTRPDASPVASATAREITLQELAARGVPRSTFQNWPAAGVLVATGRRGVYLTTPLTEERIARVLARSGPTPAPVEGRGSRAATSPGPAARRIAGPVRAARRSRGPSDRSGRPPAGEARPDRRRRGGKAAKRRD